MNHNLAGLRVLNTRPTKEAQALSQSILDAKGLAIECPTIEIKPYIPQTVPNLAQVNKAIFVSPSAVDFCFQTLLNKELAWPNHIQVFAIGKATAKRLHDWGINVHGMPDEPDSEHLLALSTLQHIKFQNIMLVKGLGGRDLIEKGLLAIGANVIKFEVYQRCLPNLPPNWCEAIWRNDLVDIILITSLESLMNLFRLFGTEAKSWLQSKPYIVISKRLLLEASKLGIKTLIISPPEGIMNTLLGVIHE